MVQAASGVVLGMIDFADYVRHDALGLAAWIADGGVSASEVLDTVIARADAVDPTINALAQRFDDRARARLADGPLSGPFAGVPFLFKDLYTFQAGVPAENGNRLWKGFVAPIDFTYVQRCEAAGFVSFGRTTSSEEGVNVSTESVATGPTRNPWALDRTTGGSSGGAAAAVAAGIVPMAHGSDGGGSIRIPAAQCGLFGLKPTRGRTSMGPLVGEGWAGLAGNHVVSRSVRDSAAMLDATRGGEPGDPYAVPLPARPYLDEVGAEPGRLRVAFHLEGLDGVPLDPENQRAVREAAALLEGLGHDVAEDRPELDIEGLITSILTVVAANLWNGMTLRYAALGRAPDGRDLERVTWEFAQRGRRHTAADYAQALTTFHTASRHMANFFKRYDVLVSTTMRRPPFPLGVLRTDKLDFEAFIAMIRAEMPVTSYFNMTGGPAMSVPLHWTEDGLPVGIHVGAAYGREDTLFRLAAQLEEARPWFGKRPTL